MVWWAIISAFAPSISDDCGANEYNYQDDTYTCMDII